MFNKLFKPCESKKEIQIRVWKLVTFWVCGYELINVLYELITMAIEDINSDFNYKLIRIIVLIIINIHRSASSLFLLQQYWSQKSIKSKTSTLYTLSNIPSSSSYGTNTRSGSEYQNISKISRINPPPSSLLTWKATSSILYFLIFSIIRLRRL